MKINFNTAVVLIPHQDDEINLLGGLIPLLRNLGVDFHFVYLTNGDAFFNGDIRIREAINALKILGIEKSNIHFLGYPDSNNLLQNCLYKHQDVLTTKYGNRTYGY